MLPKDFDPHTCYDEEVLRIYFLSLGFFSEEEAAAMAASWAIKDPQTMDQVEAGRRWEEKNRLSSAERWASELGKDEKDEN